MRVTVTGLMRSGTSLCAKTLCEMGFNMGGSMAMPIYDLKPEYEDLALVLPIQSAVFRGDLDADVKPFFERYVSGRDLHQSAAALQQPRARGWGVKTPMLMLFWDQWLSVCWPDMKVIVTERNVDETLDSIDRVVAHSPQLESDLYAVQDLLIERYNAVAETADLRVKYHELVANPVGTLTPLLEAA